MSNTNTQTTPKSFRGWWTARGKEKIKEIIKTILCFTRAWFECIMYVFINSFYFAFWVAIASSYSRLRSFLFPRKKPNWECRFSVICFFAHFLIIDEGVSVKTSTSVLIFEITKIQDFPHKSQSSIKDVIEYFWAWDECKLNAADRDKRWQAYWIFDNF